MLSSPFLVLLNRSSLQPPKPFLCWVTPGPHGSTSSKRTPLCSVELSCRLLHNPQCLRQTLLYLLILFVCLPHHLSVNPSMHPSIHPSLYAFPPLCRTQLFSPLGNLLWFGCSVSLLCDPIGTVLALYVYYTVLSDMYLFSLLKSDLFKDKLEHFKRECMCMCVCLYMCVCVCIYACVYVCVSSVPQRELIYSKSSSRIPGGEIHFAFL